MGSLARSPVALRVLGGFWAFWTWSAPVGQPLATVGSGSAGLDSVLRVAAWNLKSVKSHG